MVNNIEPVKVLLVDSSGIVIKAGEKAIRLIETKPLVNLQEGVYL